MSHIVHSAMCSFIIVDMYTGVYFQFQIQHLAAANSPQPIHYLLQQLPAVLGNYWAFWKIWKTMSVTHRELPIQSEPMQMHWPI